MTFLAKIVAWITSGYPEGVPGPDRVPLFALLKRRLSDDEVKAVARELKDLGDERWASINIASSRSCWTIYKLIAMKVAGIAVIGFIARPARPGWNQFCGET